MANIIELQPGVLRWARERAGLDIDTLAKKIGVKSPQNVLSWEENGHLTFTQAENLAHHTHTPFGYLFLDAPLKESLPIPDFRTVDDRHPAGFPSPELLDTVQTMQMRQNWMRDRLIEEGHRPLKFIGSKTLKDSPETVAADMLNVLGISDKWAQKESNWENALRTLFRHVDNAGVLIFINGVVGNNTHRSLDAEEFRGFALCDDYAPLIFINGADARPARMFTIVHELAHLWIRQDGVSNFNKLLSGNNQAEQFCNRVAAEFLVPKASLRNRWQAAKNSGDPYNYLAKHFKVSQVVAARRAFDLGMISREEFFDFYHNYVRAWQDGEQRKQEAGESRGDFWNTQNIRVGERFGRAVICAAKEGRLLYREAYQLIGIRGTTFDNFARHLGFATP